LYRLRLAFLLPFVLFGSNFATRAANAGIGKPSPTYSNVRYGPFKRNTLDLWLPEREGPVPLLLYFHGGGFKQGGKFQISGNSIRRALDNGIAIASVQYRFVHRNNRGNSQRTGIQYSLRDSARALQYLRHFSNKFRLDKERVASFGDSAGAGTSLWLATHDDLAYPENPDPVLRESSRILAAGLIHGQFSYDMTQWDAEFTRKYGTGITFFGASDPSPFYGLTPREFAGEEGAKWRADVDMRRLLSPDDPPIIMVCRTRDRQPMSTMGFAHHPLHAELIEKRCREVGVEMVCLTPHLESADAVHFREDSDPVLTFLIQKLSAAPVNRPTDTEATPTGQPITISPPSRKAVPSDLIRGAPVPVEPTAPVPSVGVGRTD